MNYSAPPPPSLMSRAEEHDMMGIVPVQTHRVSQKNSNIYDYEKTAIRHYPVTAEGKQQTCAKVPKRSETLGSLSPRSGTLMDLGPCTSFL